MSATFKIEVLLRNNDFITRKWESDNRVIQYKARLNDKDIIWISRQRLLSYMDDPNYKILNVKKSGNKIVPVIDKNNLKVVKLTKDNVGKLRKLFEGYIRNVGNSDYMDGSVYYIENLLKTNFKKLQNTGYLGVNNDSIECVFNIDNSKTLNVPFVYTIFGEDSDNFIVYMSKLSKQIKNSVFYFEYTPRTVLSDNTFKSCDLHSSFATDRVYNFYHGGYYTEYNPNILALSVERKYFPDLYDINEITIECLTPEELDSYFRHFSGLDYSGTWRNNYNQVSLGGFTYLKWDELHYSRKDLYFLTALYKNNVIGVIKFGVWDGPKHQAVSYIDVSEKYRNKGIAKKLISNLEKYLYDDLTLVLTDESDMGKMCNMNEKFRNAIKKVKVKTYSECLRDCHYN